MGATSDADALDESDLRSFAASRLGQTLGARWVLTEVLGVGGTACVYAATHRNGARVAIKVLHPELSRSARLRRRFLSEGYAANRVGHLGAVIVLDEAEEPDGTAFLVMELLQGSSLDRLLSTRGKLPWREVAELTIGILDVLAVAHDAHVLHRDLKPSNIFLTSAGQIKLLDFGTAKVEAWQGEQVITKSGTTLGTPAFMAPELAAGCTDDVDALTDLWAVGATMFQLLLNRTVHVALSGHEAIVAAATRSAPRLRSLSSDLPHGLADIVDRALAYQKCDRFPNARAMQAALERLLGVAIAPGLATAPEVEGAGTAGPPAMSRRWQWGVLVGSALSLVAVRFAWSRSSSAQPPAAAALPLVSTTAPAPQTVPNPGHSPPVLPAPSAMVADPAASVEAAVNASRRPKPAASSRALKPPKQAEAMPSADPSSNASDLLDRWR